MFSFRSFMVSGLIFRSLIHCEFISVYGVRKWSSFIRWHVTFQFSQHYLLKRWSFPIVYSCLLCCRLIDLIIVSLFLGSHFAPLVYVYIFVSVSYRLDYYRYVLYLEIWNCDTYSFVLLSQDCFVYWGLLWFHKNFRIIYSTSVTNAIVIALNL